MKEMKKKFSVDGEVFSVLEDVLGCKWTVRVITSIAAGSARPGELQRKISGISAKILNQRLRKLLKYNLITRRSFSQIPPRVEYKITPAGKKIIKVLSQLEEIGKAITN